MQVYLKLKAEAYVAVIGRTWKVRHVEACDSSTANGPLCAALPAADIDPELVSCMLITPLHCFSVFVC